MARDSVECRLGWVGPPWRAGATDWPFAYYPGVVAAFKVLWLALVALYDEMATLMRANVVWTLLSLPIGAVVVLLLGLVMPAAGEGTDASTGFWPLLEAALLLLLLPTPAGVALGELARIATEGEAPSYAAFRGALREGWKPGLRLTLTSYVVLVMLGVNVAFYALVAPGWLRLVSVLWVYALILWLGMQLYVIPLSLHLARPGLVEVYRRAALIALGHPVFTFTLTALLLPLVFLMALFPLLVPLLGAAYVALVHAHAFRTIRAWHGDLQPRDADTA